MAKIRYLPLFALMIFFGPTIGATSVRAVELDELVRGAEQIFWGRVTDIRQGVLPGMGLGYTEYTLAVNDWIKGGTGSTVTFRQLGRAAGPAAVPGMPVYKRGAEVLLFLHGPSRIGLTSPVGMQQGYYPVGKDLSGARYVTLGTMASSVVRFRSQVPGAKSALPDGTPAAAMPLDEFVALLRQMK